LAAAALLSTVFPARADAETQTRRVDSFDGVAMGGAGELEIIVGKEQSVVLEGDNAMLGHIKTDVHENTLQIGDDGSWWPPHLFRGRLKVRITMPRLERLSFSGSGNSSVIGLDGGTTSLRLDGAGSIKAQGRLDRLALAINGSGSADLPDLSIDDAGITINGSGDVVLQPHQSLVANINGSGSVL
jgi:hypothetical protein